MTRSSFERPDASWKRFVVEHGHRASAHDLAFILQRSVEEISLLRATGVCSKRAGRKNFVALFQLWHGREPEENDWPPPRKVRCGEYEWQAPELALLASLVGRLGKAEIAQTLTARLQLLTNDPGACRSAGAVQNTISRIGMQSADVVGGITTAAAGKEIGSLAIVNQAIHKGDLRPVRVGRRWVIPHDAWTAWKGRRVFPPDGYVPLATLKQPLAIRSDKLSEFARMGHVPSAVRCNPYGTGLPSTQFGTWYIAPEVAKGLIADRHAGRPMPWHGKPIGDNLRVTYRLWQSRQHPTSCKTCADIWGQRAAPKTFEDYAERYPPLAHGAKRHLTLLWNPGLLVAEVARKAGCSVAQVRRAIENGTLSAATQGRTTFVTRTDATRWISRGTPAGDTQKSWISLETAQQRYLFTSGDLKGFMASGALKSKTGTHGAMRGIVSVSKAQCAKLREEIGFTEQEAARRAKITVPQLQEALRGVNWRGTGAIPLSTVQAVIKRLQSSPGYTIEEAAEVIGKDASWVGDRIRDGTVRPLRTKHDHGRLYLSEPMIQRLRRAFATPQPRTITQTGWLRLGEAALEAGVTTATIIKWAKCRELERIADTNGWRYPRDAVRARARSYWQSTRFRRATPPQWLGAVTAR
jgi:hypothetical protein